MSYGQGLTPRVLRRMFYGLNLQAESWKIHRHYSLLCVGIHVYERISYTALSKREACISEENREIQSNTKCYSAATYCKWLFYTLERKKDLFKKFSSFIKALDVSLRMQLPETEEMLNFFFYGALFQ